MTLRSAGPNARNGVNRSQALCQVATAAGYFLPSAESANVGQRHQRGVLVGAV